MIQQRTRVLKKKGDCLRPYALNNCGLNYQIIELDKIKLEADFIQDDSYYSYLPNASPSLKLIGTYPNLPHQSQPSNQPSTTSQPPSSTNQSSNNHSHASPLNNTNRNSNFASQNTPVNRAQKRINSPMDDDDELLCSQEKVFSQNLKRNSEIDVVVVLILLMSDSPRINILYVILLSKELTSTSSFVITRNQTPNVALQLKRPLEDNVDVEHLKHKRLKFTEQSGTLPLGSLKELNKRKKSERCNHCLRSNHVRITSINCLRNPKNPNYNSFQKTVETPINAHNFDSNEMFEYTINTQSSVPTQSVSSSHTQNSPLFIKNTSRVRTPLHTELEIDLLQQQKNYLNELNSKKNGPLHQQNWVNEKLKKIHNEIDDLKQFFCENCHEFWPSKINHCTQCSIDNVKYSKLNDMVPGIDELDPKTKKVFEDLTVVEEILISPILYIAHNIRVDEEALNQLPENSVPEKKGPELNENNENLDIDDDFYNTYVEKDENQILLDDQIKNAINFPNASQNTLNEYQNDSICSLAFPKLFPNGAVDPTKKARLKEFTESLAFNNLMKSAAKRYKYGHFYYAWAKHQRFKFWAYDRLRRHRSLDQYKVFFKHNVHESNLSMNQLKSMINNISNYTFESNLLMKKMSTYSANITGSDAYWYESLVIILIP
ncbi:ATP-dependent DNA helicase PIF1 [Brachionus plicatilis]|uniref:ATP-dependent DNA helicase PIF1 n=1 Tax=Brachionus plicatilis TaxID=10195 RepID=A0A3M7SDZ2_BRAPC|nr:ATP-dependent DNA helicase PIF1 [Brachionus plicatilis]